jgi:hypothetical protein
MADSAAFRQLLEPFEIILVEPQSDLLGARGSNLNVQILKFVAEFLETVLTPEFALGLIALEARQLGLSIVPHTAMVCRTNYPNKLSPQTINKKKATEQIIPSHHGLNRRGNKITITQNHHAQTGLVFFGGSIWCGFKARCGSRTNIEERISN